MFALLLLLASALATTVSPGELRDYARTQPKRSERTDVAPYRFTRDILLEAAQRAAHKPGAVHVEVVGHSLENRPIVAFHVSEPGVEIERKVLIFAGIHALEWISTETATDLLLELVELPPRGVGVTIVPILNPDGRARVESDLNAGRNEYRRGNARFADLNRDFAHQRDQRAIWRKIIPGYYRTTAPEPFSQPESAAIDALAGRGYDRVASLHAFGGYLYHPWAGAWERTEDHAEYVAMGRKMEAAQGGRAYRTRQLSRWGFFFRAHGTELDHMYAEHGAQSWLFEITRSGADWRRPLHSYRTYFRWYNPTNPRPHSRRAVAALRELIRTDPHRGG